MATNHASDHNLAASALADLVARGKATGLVVIKQQAAAQNGMNATVWNPVTGCSVQFTCVANAIYRVSWGVSVSVATQGAWVNTAVGINGALPAAGLQHGFATPYLSNYGVDCRSFLHLYGGGVGPGIPYYLPTGTVTLQLYVTGHGTATVSVTASNPSFIAVESVPPGATVT
jgi:hypothetical protein